jgi:hypothetical protein
VTSAEADSPPLLDSEDSGSMVSLREHFRVRRGEVHHVRGRLGSLSRAQEKLLESLSRDIIETVRRFSICHLKLRYSKASQVLDRRQSGSNARAMEYL